MILLDKSRIMVYDYSIEKKRFDGKKVAAARA